MMRAFYRPRTRPASHDLSQPSSITLIAGPTASGKSALALKMARETGAMIINADSQQLYADLRILTARPSAEDEAQADHQLYGVADAADAWSVGRWSRAVMALLDDLREHGRPAIVVGGTGLYFTSLTRGLADIPAVPSAVRDEVNDDYLTQGEMVFRSRLAQVDPDAASTIQQGDRQRLVRAMSVFVASGRSVTGWKADTQPLLPTGSWKGLVIEPNRQVLYKMCDLRVDLMMAQGAMDEVEVLLARGLNAALPAMKAVGVREMAAHLTGGLARDDAVAALKQATRNYAKRQLTWFRNQNSGWCRCTGNTDLVAP
ncbi:tRNA (adenosine(37)-N6)-dimethylallyltransferase MiaA [Brevundimonas vesicularis]|uniref:tRNA (adenosine(37)-N6)-dimethylallyltransferase MiaA n=1 Tax=Brevundimonas vesicularis TaxID=41276 RepID=UPI00384E81F1